jgi:hypothetical protein
VVEEDDEEEGSKKQGTLIRLLSVGLRYGTFTSTSLNTRGKISHPQCAGTVPIDSYVGCVRVAKGRI